MIRCLFLLFQFRETSQSFTFRAATKKVSATYSSTKSLKVKKEVQLLLANKLTLPQLFFPGLICEFLVFSSRILTGADLFPFTIPQWVKHWNYALNSDIKAWF